MKNLIAACIVYMIAVYPTYAQDNRPDNLQRTETVFSPDIFLSKQVRHDTTFSKEDLLKKSKNQKLTGWILLGAGVALSAGGLIYYNATVDDESAESNNGLYMLLAGVSSTVVSIPFFVRSSKNAKLAAKLSLHNQKFLLPHNGSIAYKTQPALSVSIRF